MMFRSIAFATTISLLSTAVSTTAHAGENTAAARDDVAAPATPPGAVFTEAPARRPAPQAGTGRVAGEVLAGVAVGAGLGITASALAYPRVEEDCSDPDNPGAGIACEIGNGVRAVAIGGLVYPLGVGLGVGVVGNLGDVHGSYGAAIGGAYLGSLAGALLGVLAPEESAGSIALIGFLAGAPIGAVIGHTMTLEHDMPRTGLVNVSGSSTRLSIPAVSVTADPLHAQGTLTSIRLMDGRF
jgi:hypothetical protein